MPLKISLSVQFLRTILFAILFIFGTHGEVGNSTTNGTDVNITSTTTSPPPTTPEAPPALPPQGDAEKEHRNSMAIFFILIIIALAILLVHFLLTTKLHFIPDSLAIVFLGSVVGFVLSFTGKDWTNEEAFSPNMFFLVLLPPIIFESGYNLHKGNFFANFGSILVFALVGTLISALVIGGGVYILGQADLIYALTPVQSFAFGSLISAVDPVATLAIFQAIKVDPVLYMLVFGESMLNDAVAIVLTTTILELNHPAMKALGAGASIMASMGRFFLMFFGSAGIGIVTALVSALLLKFVNLHNTPSLEYGFLLLFAYLPYGLAEAINLSGIMAILFCGIVMSHYTHFNLSAVTQVTVQQTFRTLAFMAETCVFAYLGMALFTFPLVFKPAFICWCIVLCLLARAVNIFPLARLLNHFREHKITPQMQFLMWFSGLRGAIAFALSLHMDFEDAVTRRVIVTSTLSIVLFTLIILGGSTMPLIKFLTQLDIQKKPKSPRRRKRRSSRRRPGDEARRKEVTLSKTHEMGQTIDADSWSFSEQTESEDNAAKVRNPTDFLRQPVTVGALAKLDAKYFRPFFTRRFTQQERQANTMKLTEIAFQWYRDVQAQSDGQHSDDNQAATNVGLDASFFTSTQTPTASASNSNAVFNGDGAAGNDARRRDSFESICSVEDQRPLLDIEVHR